MHQNDVLCDLFIGKGAGKNVMTDINNAQRSVRIISPYVSASLIWQLIKLKRSGVEVQLITTDAIMDSTESAAGTFKHLISQEKVIDKKAQTYRTILSVIEKIAWLAVVGASVWGLLNMEHPGPNFRSALIIFSIALVAAIILRVKISGYRTFNYRYDTLFPFKLLIAPENADYPIKTFIHSKVYIIDEEIMYWGSLNFTAAGTQDNYETRIKTKDPEAIHKMSLEFSKMMISHNLPERNLSVWGKMIYSIQNNDVKKEDIA